MKTNGKPETLWELCEQVCEAIRMSPKNYTQETWATDARSLNEEACGTAYCRAGWMVALTSDEKDILSKYHTGSLNICISASNMLKRAGVVDRDIDTLFSGAAVDRQCYRDGIEVPDQGTPEYAEQGVKGMREFMEKWEKQLKETKIDD